MSIDQLIRLGQLIVAIVGFIGVGWTIYLNAKAIEQKRTSDNRAEWFRRYTWAADKTLEEGQEARALGWENLTILVTSALITDTEADIILTIAINDQEGHNEPTDESEVSHDD